MSIVEINFLSNLTSVVPNAPIPIEMIQRPGGVHLIRINGILRSKIFVMGLMPFFVGPHGVVIFYGMRKLRKVSSQLGPAYVT